jgi:cell division inhibitor SepF
VEVAPPRRREGRLMGAWRKAGVWLGLVEEDDRRYDEDDDYDAYDDDYAEPAPRRVERPVERIDRGDRVPVRAFSRVSTVGAMSHDNLALAPQVSVRERAAVSEDEVPYRITTLHPTTYNEARTIGEHFRDSVPVIMNLTEMDEADAKRLVDFAAGLAFGLRGSIERVTNRVFLLSPANVDVTAEDKAKIAEGGFFNQS